MVLNAWKRVHHPNIIALRNCYLSNGAVFFVHDFYPTATSLYDCFLKVLLSLFSLIPTERPAWLRSASRRPSLVHRHPTALRLADHPRLQSRLSHPGLSPRPHDRAKPLPDRQCRRDGHSRAAQHQPRPPSQGSLPAGIAARRARLSRRGFPRYQNAGRALQREVREGRAAAAVRTDARVRRAGAVHDADREDAEQFAVDVRHVLQRSRRIKMGR